ncbi:methionine ABC transporter permease [Mixta tenebrionis]|uniref:ABC transporter permease subunit n=1 Tax=Mixta tenebrionis TaxID=2562439 RepID=A0A506V128_9GAMM|nr:MULTISPECIES: ABC transporter permease subunit [Mixta]QHM77421.1 Methionine import system permease protein MetP [Mixta theicola]TPW39258.1 ABC transporter permease subunit [Mixta tenebrionis]
MLIDFAQSRVFEYLPKVILPACLATLAMLVISLLLSTIVGVSIAVMLTLSHPKGLAPNRYLYRIFNTLIDAIRSFPAIILIVLFTPLTRWLIGTSVGWIAAVVPLTIVAFPAVARLIENALLEVDKNVILAARSFGASNRQIITKVMFSEAAPAIVSSMTFASIQLLANTALAGAVGAGGLGAVALTYGYQRFDDLMTYAVVFILSVIVLVIQYIGRITYRLFK